MTKLIEQREHFEATKTIHESAKLTFHGVEGFDVYNPSIPFERQGRRYIFGRVERRGEWARSWVRLFEASGKDDWTLVPKSMVYQLEDPYVAMVGGELVMGGTHVRYSKGAVDTYYGYFYRGVDIDDLHYFTTGPDRMKDIRLVQLLDGRIGVFSRPRGEDVRQQNGSESVVGFSVIDKLDDLCAEVVENAPLIPGLFAQDEWGGCNQAYRLDSGLIGVIGHKSCMTGTAQTYLNVSFVFDPVRHEAFNLKIIGTRSCYPAGPAKKPHLFDCAFTAGVVMREDGKADLYSGVGDCEAGRICIDNPFAGHGRIAK